MSGFLELPVDRIHAGDQILIGNREIRVSAKGYDNTRPDQFMLRMGRDIWHLPAELRLMVRPYR